MAEWVRRVSLDSNAVEITQWQGLSIELQYADTLKKDLYCGESRAFLHRVAARKLEKVLLILKEKFPGYSLVIMDAARPRHAQEALWNEVRGTGQMLYVSNPRKGSLHNFGMAIDIAARKPDGSLVDMGCQYDEFSSLASASPRVMDSLVHLGLLTPRQRENRRIFTQVLRSAGFIQLPSEWWHFNAASSAWVRENMRFLGE